MKQINLLPKKTMDETFVFIHPFWKAFIKVSSLAIVLSLLYPYFYSQVLSNSAETLNFLSDFSSGLQKERDWFNSLIEERRTLEGEIEALETNASGDESNIRKFAVGISPIFRKAIDFLPTTVWLQDISCDYNGRSVQLTGFSERKEFIHQFLNDGLMQDHEFHDLIIHNLRRMDGENAFYFYASFQFDGSIGGKQPRETDS